MNELNALYSWILDVIGTITSTLIALLRLFFLAINFITSGVQIILFSRTEICNIEMKGQPFRCDKKKILDRIAYVDKLCLENPDLLDSEEVLFLSEEDQEDTGDDNEPLG